VVQAMTTNVRQALRFQNTYRLESKNPFNHDQVAIILKSSMDHHFAQLERFEQKTTALLCRDVSDEVIEQVKEKNFDR
jgi:hypothetical protein